MKLMNLVQGTMRVILVLLLACAGSNQSGPASHTSKTANQTMPEMPGKALLPQYKLGFGDVVEIKFFRNAQFNETVTVRPDGRISLPKVGEVLVSGMTPAELDSLVTNTYGQFILDPDVTVIVREFGGYQVYVLGEVSSPGGYPVQRNMTVLQAIAAAGGAKISAKMANVMILRRGQGEEVEAIKVNASETLKGNNIAFVTQNDLFLQPHDIVFVPKTLVASVSDFMRQVYAGFLPPLDLYLRAVLFYDR